MRSFKPFIPDSLPGFPEIDDSVPLDIEIGCGVGWHPISYASANPDRRLIAIEHTKEKYEKFLRRYQRHKLPNLNPIHANAISYLGAHLQPNMVDRFFFLYPNPNPKNASRRFSQMPFIRFLIETLNDMGQMTFVSNESWYIEEVNSSLSDYFLKTDTKMLSMCRDHQFAYRTHFEKKYLESGQTCYEITLTGKNKQLS